VGFDWLESFYGLIRRVVAGFDAAGLDYMFTGALAASFYGVARTTVDIDVVVKALSEGDRARLASALKRAGLRVDERKIDAALESDYGIATFRDRRSPYSVDVIFSRGRLKKMAGTVAGLPTFFQAPEDLVLAKLRMIKATVPRERAFKDEEDVRAVLKFSRVNVQVVRKQAKRDSTLGVLESLMIG